MSTNKIIFVFFFFCFGFAALAQSARIKGVILDKNNQAVANVNVSCLGETTQSNTNGFYDLKIPANQKVTVIFTHISLKKVSVSNSFKRK